jgi:hypothetical protein
MHKEKEVYDPNHTEQCVKQETPVVTILIQKYINHHPEAKGRVCLHICHVMQG